MPLYRYCIYISLLIESSETIILCNENTIEVCTDNFFDEFEQYSEINNQNTIDLDMELSDEYSMEQTEKNRLSPLREKIIKFATSGLIYYFALKNNMSSCFFDFYNTISSKLRIWYRTIILQN